MMNLFLVSLLAGFVSGVGAYAIWLMAYLASVEAYHAQA